MVSPEQRELGRHAERLSVIDPSVSWQVDQIDAAGFPSASRGLSQVASRCSAGDFVFRASSEPHSPLSSAVISTSVSPTDAASSLLIRRNPGDEWGVLYSSGTTGVPKGIERSQESIVTELVGWCLELGLNRQTVFYVGRPVYYTGGLLLTLATLLVGGTAILNDYNDASLDESWKDYQATLEKHPVDWAFFVPDQLRAFLKHVCHGERRLTARTVLTMGAPIAAIEKRQFADTFLCDVVESWGNSESLCDVKERPDCRYLICDGGRTNHALVSD